jgi:hypothetical protein
VESGRRPEDPPAIPTEALERLGLRFYVDTNFVDDPAPAAQSLRERHRHGWINLVRTDTVDTELETAQDPAKRDKLLDASSEYVESLGPVVLDNSRLDHAVLGSDDDEDRLDRVFRILFPDSMRSETSTGRARRKVRDAMHVTTAIRYAGTAFITRDETDLLPKAKAIADAFDGFRIMSPEDALELTERMRARYVHRHGE